MSRPLWLLLLPALVAFKSCDPSPIKTDSESEPQWYLTCGDPVCQGYTGPFDGVALCTTEKVGEGCDTTGETCDPQNDCNARLTCATEDPTAQPGGCPISRRQFKHDIHYLSAAQRADVAADALQLKVATWNYNWDQADAPAHLGFIIDDAPQSYAVAADGNHVDLYGYTSMALVTVQAQQAQLEAQQAEMAAQKLRMAEQDARIARLEAELARLVRMEQARR